MEINLARRHLGPNSWGKAFKELLEVEGVRLGSGAQKAETENFAVLAEKHGVSERTARDRIALAELECPVMSESTGEEHSNLYMRGVNEAASGKELDAQDILDVLNAFGEDGVRSYLIGILEGIEGLAEQEIEEYEMLEASIAYVVHQSSVANLEESEETIQFWLEEAPKDLSAGIDLHIVDDEDELVGGGRIVTVEFKDGTDQDAESGREESEDSPALVTVEKWKYEIVEYLDPEDGP